MHDLTELDVEVITEYEQVLIGNQRTIDSYYFANKTPEANSHTALMLIQYVCETYLQWSPKKVFDSLSMSVLKEWKLANLLKHIKYPPELNQERNIGYIAHLIYPAQVPINDKDVCLMVYKQLLDGDIKKFPKGFFTTSQGMNRVCYCLKYAIDHYLNFTSIDEMYEFFGTERCLKFLRDYRLNPYLKDLFDAPITVLFVMTPQEQSDPFLFNVYRFWQIFNEYRRRDEECRGKRPIHKHVKVDKEDIKHVQVEF